MFCAPTSRLVLRPLWMHSSLRGIARIVGASTSCHWPTVGTQLKLVSPIQFTSAHSGFEHGSGCEASISAERLGPERACAFPVKWESAPWVTSLWFAGFWMCTFASHSRVIARRDVCCVPCAQSCFPGLHAMPPNLLTSRPQMRICGQWA